jgi:hypothetical protein
VVDNDACLGSDLAFEREDQLTIDAPFKRRPQYLLEEDDIVEDAQKLFGDSQ